MSMYKPCVVCVSLPVPDPREQREHLHELLAARR